MSSLPTVSQMKPDEFDAQWEVMKTIFKQTNVNMEAVMLVTQSLLQIMNTGGFGSVRISILGNIMQEVEIKQNRRSDLIVVKGFDPLPFGKLDKDSETIV